jgi:hypothetical protein
VPVPEPLPALVHSPSAVIIARSEAHALSFAEAMTPVHCAISAATRVTQQLERAAQLTPSPPPASPPSDALVAHASGMANASAVIPPRIQTILLTFIQRALSLPEPISEWRR